MIIFKSFIRKKTTRIYLIILTMLLTAFLILSYERQVSINKVNTIFPQTLEIKSSDANLINNLNNKNIKDIKVAIPFKCGDYFSGLILNDNSLLDNEIIANDLYKSEDSHFIDEYIGNNTIVGEYDDKSIAGTCHVYVNEKNFNKIKQTSNEYTYYISLKEWYKRENTKEQLKEEYNLKNMNEVGESSPSKDIYEGYAHIFTVFSILIGIIFSITLLITVKNISIDEKKNNVLLSYLGYNKKLIITYSFLKILFLLILSSIISIIITLMFNVL